jgi:hypothetical protein
MDAPIRRAVAHNGQTQTETLHAKFAITTGMGSIERREHVLCLLGRHPQAVISDPDGAF